MLAPTVVFVTSTTPVFPVTWTVSARPPDGELEVQFGALAEPHFHPGLLDRREAGQLGTDAVDARGEEGEEEAALLVGDDRTGCRGGCDRDVDAWQRQTLWVDDLAAYGSGGGFLCDGRCAQGEAHQHEAQQSLAHLHLLLQRARRSRPRRSLKGACQQARPTWVEPGCERVEIWPRTAGSKMATP